jgi:hypothetical protein
LADYYDRVLGLQRGVRRRERFVPVDDERDPEHDIQVIGVGTE